MSGDEVMIVFVTAPDEATADRLASAVVGARLAACASCIPGVRSTYRWQGEIRREAELLLILKTTRGRLDALQALVAREHPYELPEVLAVPAAGGSPRYLDWVRGEVAGAGE